MTDMDEKVIEKMATAYAAAWKADIERHISHAPKVPSWEAMGEGQREAMRRVARVVWPIARAAALREAAGIIDDRASHLRSAAAADRSRNNPMGGLWYDTRAVEASEHAAALLKEAETTEAKQ